MRYIRLIILILTIANVSCNDDDKKIAYHLSLARKFIYDTQYEKALTHLDSVEQIDIKNNEIHILEAEIKLASDNYEGARNQLKKLISRSYKNDTVYYMICRTYFNESDYHNSMVINEWKSEELLKRAIQYADLAIDKNPMYKSAFILKFKSLHNLGKHQEALQVANTILDLFPNDGYYLFMRGVEKHLLGNKIGALDDITLAINDTTITDYQLSEIYRFRGYFYLVEKMYDEAISNYKTSLEYNSTNYQSLFERGDCYRMKNLNDLACKDYRKAAEYGFELAFNAINEYCK